MYDSYVHNWFSSKLLHNEVLLKPIIKKNIWGILTKRLFLLLTLSRK